MFGTWQEIACEMTNLPFLKENKLLVDLPENGDPYSYFSLLFDDGLMSEIVAQTNIYAVEVLSYSQSTRCRIVDWKELTIEEFRIFLGLTLHMGTIKLNHLQDYWKKHRLFNLTCFSNYMSRDRYQLILRCLHFATNPGEQEQQVDRIYKIRPIIEHFNNKMNQIYYPGKNLSLDESMMLWKGRLVFRQYIQNKRHKYGLKLYM